MFLDAATRTPRMKIEDGIAALFELEPGHAFRARRTVAAVVTARDAAREARLLAPALRACRVVGDELGGFVLPVGDESSVHGATEAVRRTLGVEHIEVIPAPRPTVTPGFPSIWSFGTPIVPMSF